MGYVAIMKWDAAGRVEKFARTLTAEEAQGHVAQFAGAFPEAFAAELPEAPLRDWKVVDAALTVDPVVETATLSEVIAERDRRMAVMASAYTPTERETWPVQVAEARAVLADDDAPTPLLTPIAEARGSSVADLARHVLALHDAFAAASGALMAAARKIADMDTIPADFTDDKHWP